MLACNSQTINNPIWIKYTENISIITFVLDYKVELQHDKNLAI